MRGALKRSLHAFLQLLPVLVGMLLLSSLVLSWLPRVGIEALFGRHEVLDVVLGAVLGSIAMGHPSAGYILGGELLASGVGFVAVSALIVAWVTVGIVQLPAEMLLLGRRFALWRNLLAFLSAIAIAYLTVGVLYLSG